MCDPITAIGTAVSVGGSLMQHSAQKSAASDQKAYNARIEASRREYAEDVKEWQDQKYQNDLSHIEDILDYRAAEFGRYKQWRAKVEDNVKENYIGKLGTTMARMAEEYLSSHFRDLEVRNQALQAEGDTMVGAASRGVAGNSVRAMLGEIERQEAQATLQNNLSNDATQKQLQREMQAFEGEAENTLLNLPRLTFQPIRMPDEPAPVNPVEPSPPVSSPSALGAGLQMISTGINTYSALSGN